MPSQFDFGYIDFCIDQLTAVEDAFNIYRETGCLDALQRLNADSKSKPFLQKWLDIAKLPESDRTLTQLKSDSFNISRLSPYSDIMLHCQKDWRNPLDLIHIIYVYRGTFRCQMKNRDLTLTTGNCFMFNVNIGKQISPCDSNAQLLNCLISRNYLENILLKQFDQNILFSDFLTQSFYTDSTSEPMLAFDTSGDLDVKYAFAMAIIEHANHRPLWQTRSAAGDASETAAVESSAEDAPPPQPTNMAANRAATRIRDNTFFMFILLKLNFLHITCVKEIHTSVASECCKTVAVLFLITLIYRNIQDLL